MMRVPERRWSLGKTLGSLRKSTLVLVLVLLVVLVVVVGTHISEG